MAVIHISEAEAALNLAGLLARVRAGDEVRIEDRTHTVAVLRAPEAEVPRRTLSEAIRLSKERKPGLTLDDHFGSDLEAVVRQHNKEVTSDPWESF